MRTVGLAVPIQIVFFIYTEPAYFIPRNCMDIWQRFISWLMMWSVHYDSARAKEKAPPERDLARQVGGTRAKVPAWVAMASVRNMPR